MEKVYEKKPFMLFLAKFSGQLHQKYLLLGTQPLIRRNKRIYNFHYKNGFIILLQAHPGAKEIRERYL